MLEDRVIAGVTVTGHVDDIHSINASSNEQLCNTYLYLLEGASKSNLRKPGMTKESRGLGMKDIQNLRDFDSDSLTGWLIFAHSLISSEQAKDLTETVSRSLISIIFDIDGEIANVDLLGPSQKQRVLDWNDNYIEPAERAVPHDSWDGNLTYAELRQLVDYLAACLVSQGLCAEVLVPMCFYKSKWAIVAMLAFMKAGGAFVPLDPSSPNERRQGIVKEAGGHLVLASPELADTIEAIDKYLTYP